MSMSLQLSALPYDILRILARLIDGADVASLFSTCTSLHVLLKDDAVWQEHCARYGILERSFFPGTSFYEIYTQVLHKYGPLLGLWAGDNPYSGSIIEFRLDFDSRRLIGELWNFPSASVFARIDEDWQVPRDPTFLPLVDITISNEHNPRKAHIEWPISQSRYLDGSIPEGTQNLDFHIISATNQSLYIHDRQNDSRLPDFPDPIQRPWYDATRRLPRLPVEPAFVSTFQDIQTDRAELQPSFLYMTHTEAIKPAALSIHSYTSELDAFFAVTEGRYRLPRLRYNFQDGEHRSRPHRRFYPLRLPQTIAQDPADKQWRPESLEGLWLGSYGPHGTEVLYVFLDTPSGEVRAMKITGDVNVPRGAISWAFRPEERVRPRELPQGEVGARLMFGDNLAGLRVYRGRGTISDADYREETRDSLEVFVGISSPDTIGVNWRDMGADFTPKYKRYKGRHSHVDI